MLPGSSYRRLVGSTAEEQPLDTWNVVPSGNEDRRAGEAGFGTCHAGIEEDIHFSGGVVTAGVKVDGVVGDTPFEKILTHCLGHRDPVLNGRNG